MTEMWGSANYYQACCIDSLDRFTPFSLGCSPFPLGGSYAPLPFRHTLVVACARCCSANSDCPAFVGAVFNDSLGLGNTYGPLPLSFEANQGQSGPDVKFLTRTNTYSLFLTGDEAVLTLHEGQSEKSAPSNPPASRSRIASVLRMKLRDANRSAKVSGEGELPGKSNYFIGSDSSRWLTNVPTYSKVKYQAVYPGIDLVYYGNQRQLEYDFIVAPGADPRSIAFDVSGASRIRKDAQGDLLLKIQDAEMRWHKPVVYQEKNGTRQQIAASYSITHENRIGFQLAKYDASMPLYIDPLIYSTYLGGTGSDIGVAIAVDKTGNAYVTGWTTSTDFPTVDPLQPAFAGGFSDVFVSKINAAGTALVYSTYLGGNGQDNGQAIAVDNTGSAYITGQTDSTNFPTVNAFESNPRGIFVTKINPAGAAIVYSTYLGGTGEDISNGIAVDSHYNAYVTGVTGAANFPTTPGAYQTTCDGGAGTCANNPDAFVTKLDSSGSALSYSTFLGGSGVDQGNSIAVDGDGDAYVTGQGSEDFPMVNPLPEAGPGAFVSKLNSTGTALLFSTYLSPGYNAYSHGVALDPQRNAYVAGTADPNVCGNPCKSKAFVAKINVSNSTLVYSYLIGSSVPYSGFGVAVDAEGSAYIVGTFGTSTFVDRLNPAGSALISSRVLGGGSGAGVATNGEGDALIVGTTSSATFPLKNPLQPAYAGREDAFVSKIDLRAVTTTTLISSPNPSAYGQSVTFTATVSSSIGAPPNGEVVSFMKGMTILGTGSLSGGKATFTISTLKVGTTSITAVYGGDSNFGNSKSKAVSQVVN
jgi:hypothetical protein